MKNYKILGFIAGAHSCGASYIVDGKVVAVIEEERLTRIKPYVDYENDFERYPNESIKCLIERYGLKFDEVDYFTSFFPIDTALSIFKAMFNYNIPRDKYIQIDHHESHAILSYYLSNFQEDTLVFCADASGGTNGHSSKTYLGSGGKMYYLDGINTKRKSLGHFYAALTEFLGYKRLKDEGKVVGLSGHGAIWWDLYRAWDSVITIEGTKTSEDNHHIELGGVYYDLYSKFYEFVGSKYWKNKNAVHNIAYTGQRLFEDKVIELIQNLHKKAPHTKKLALSGGIFANVKLNKRINELDEFDEIFVLPPMGDEGLAFGCAMGVMARLEEGFKPFKANDMFLGNEYSKEEVLASSKGFGRVDLDVDLVATLLQQKKILGLYQGRSEHGPRALGNRSIICDCTYEETYGILNGKLQRNDYMPFAPAILDEDVDFLFHLPKSRYSAEFMTLLVDTKEEWKGKIPTVVHPIDKTARIQIVTSSSNPLFYNILKAYKKNTGVGILVNTSFNVHNEPIVESPDNAFNHLRNGIIDYLVTPYGIFTKGKSID
jgi:carbamoyltransferase